jgi:hypothetical protein
MKEFNLSGMVTVSVYTTVKANSLEEAVKIAKERDIERHNWGDKEQSLDAWVNEGYDGEVFNIEGE